MEISPLLTVLERWKPQAGKLQQTSSPLRAPLEVTLREAVRAACFLKRRWEAQNGAPGMKSLEGLSLSLAEEVLSLVRAVQEAQLLCWVEEESLPVEDPIEVLMGQGRFQVSEMRAALNFLAKGEIPAKQKRQIEKIDKLPEHEAEDASSLLLLLRLYTEVADSLRPQLASLGESFRVTLIDEAKLLRDTLEKQVEEGPIVAPQASRVLYYQLLALLAEKVGTIRAAAGFVFRGHKSILREVTSAYERTRRRAAKKKAREKKRAAEKKKESGRKEKK